MPKEKFIICTLSKIVDDPYEIKMGCTVENEDIEYINATYPEDSVIYETLDDAREALEGYMSHISHYEADGEIHYKITEYAIEEILVFADRWLGTKKFVRFSDMVIRVDGMIYAEDDDELTYEELIGYADSYRSAKVAANFFQYEHRYEKCKTRIWV